MIGTVYVVALVNRSNQWHGQAVSSVSTFTRNYFVVTDAILLEIGSALAGRFRQRVIDSIRSFMEAPNIEIMYVTPDLFERGFAFYAERPDKEWSLVDCISCDVMRMLGISQVLTFDHHFAQAGFQPLVRGGADHRN